jgi:hypothetical protein
MLNVAHSRPADLTAARIRRAARRTMGPAINEETAREDAAIVHDIIACVRQAYIIEPTHLCWCGDESAAIQTIQRIAVCISSFHLSDDVPLPRCRSARWLREANVVNKLRYVRGLGESYSDVIQSAGIGRSADHRAKTLFSSPRRGSARS